MRRDYFSWILLIIAIVAFCGGCASHYGNEQASGKALSDNAIKLAVLPFQNVSESRDSGLIVSDTLANQLYALGKFAVVTPEMVTKRLEERETESLWPEEAGRLFGTRYILTGRVTEYTYKAGVGETPVIGVTARLIDTSSGAVLWSATQTWTGGGNWFQEDSLSRLTVMLCKNLAESLDNFLTTRPLAASRPLPESGIRPASPGSKM